MNTPIYAVIDRRTGNAVKTYTVLRYAINKARDMNNRGSAQWFYGVDRYDDARTEYSVGRLMRSN